MHDLFFHLLWSLYHFSPSVHKENLGIELLMMPLPLAHHDTNIAHQFTR